MRRARKTPLSGNASLSEWRFPLSECHCPPPFPFVLMGHLTVSAPFRKCTKTTVEEVLVTSGHLLRYLFDSLSSSPPDGLGRPFIPLARDIFKLADY